MRRCTRRHRARRRQDVPPGAYEAGFDRGEAEDVLGVGGGESVDRAAADVLAHDMHRPDSQVLDQRVKILRGDGTRIVLVRDGRVAEPAQVHRIRPVTAGEQGDELV